MTSGQFASVPVTDIWVDRATRQRRDLDDVEELAASIRDNGLIQPPVIRRSGELVVGERRWTAVKALGWSHIPVQYIEELDPVGLHLVEYEENVRRKDLTWQDQCLAVAAYNQLKSTVDEKWTASDTAQALGFSPAAISERLLVAAAISAGIARVIDAPLYSTAKGIVARDIARKRSSTLAAIDIASPRSEAQIATDEPAPRPPVPLLNADFHEWAIDYDGPKFNFIHCDFPYGVGMDKSDQGAGDGHGTYIDTEDTYWELIGTLGRHSDTLVAESAHIMFWFSMDYYSETMIALELQGWRINPFPLIWFKSDNTGILPDPSRGPRRIYETAFFGSRGDRNIVRPKSNAFAFPGQGKLLHMNEKPVPMLKHFFEMFVDEYSLVLDPTAGSANALKAATALRANHVLGLERDPEFFTRSIEGYYNDEL